VDEKLTVKKSVNSDLPRFSPIIAAFAKSAVKVLPAGTVFMSE
jgi:hypothetical protein